MVIEMSIVQPPFLLDFAQTTLDRPRDFSEDVINDWWTRVAEMFGDRFADAREVFQALARIIRWARSRQRPLCG